ncbi:hypothetical protein IFT84_08560 [Rhizobium sp. CFBP 8762]|uniref:argonaute/piwi family protein n=1 Tax=Rhizobium sp. CFBP 8762 TaxID=2775279 RepID=UPI0017849475|nr:hypothetical protein [Rhizobium sp. CFBP 8762]MBD8554581.1 hypothetical protein [Rhizobium sp. CFBP 8762]
MSQLSLNFAPLNIVGNTSVQVGRQPFDAEHLADLRSDFVDSHVFHRSGIDDTIIDIPIVKDAQPLGNVHETLDLVNERRLWPTLLSASLLRAFGGLRDILSDRPVSVVGPVGRGYLIHPELPEWIQRRTLLRFDTRTTYVDRKSTFGLVCETKLKSFINAPCSVLLEHEIPIVGRYVTVRMPASDPRVLPRLRLVGKVVSKEGDILTLSDNAEGFETVNASEAYLEPRREIMEDCVNRLLGRSARGVLDEAERQAALFHSGPGRQGQIAEALKYLRQKANLEAVPGANFVVGDLLSNRSKSFPKTESIPQPSLLFDPSGTRRDTWKERGLKESGPFDQRTFSPKQLRIAVVCQARHEGRVDEFLAKFLEGMPSVLTGAKREARYGDGFLRRFQLDKPSVRYFTASGSSADDYLSASRTALSTSADEGFKWDLAIVQVEEDFKASDGGDNPYYATKSIFLKRDVPVQSIRLETMAQPAGELVFSLNHLSLATYAKIGGTPWLLAAQQTVAHELVIGLGSHTEATSRIGTGKRFVGITTVFSSDGSYLLSDRTAVVPYEDYAVALYETLKRAITTVRTQDNWRSSDKVRLVFHMFKPLKDIEAEAVERVVRDLHLQDVTFAFVHVAPDHPFIIFDHDQKGYGFRDPRKGVLGPSRGLHLKLGDRESLVVFSGASELKRPEDGMPRPCLLKLHRLSTFTDMTYIARQAFAFAGNSWRTMSPEPFPITIRYSDLISERLTGLAAVPGWDAEAVKFGQIGRTLWFL